MLLDANLYCLLANSVSSIKSLEQSKSQISTGPLLVAPLGFRPNSIFKGFDIPLEWMDRKLKSESKSKLGSCAILLWGPPGCGKSHLARQYVYLHRDEHPAGTFWLDCKSGSSMIRDWFEIGRRIGCLNESNTNQLVSDASFISKVRQALEEQHGWLLVFDGVLFTTEIEIENFRHFFGPWIHLYPHVVVSTNLNICISTSNRIDFFILFDFRWSHLHGQHQGYHSLHGSLQSDGYVHLYSHHGFHSFPNGL